MEHILTMLIFFPAVAAILGFLIVPLPFLITEFIIINTNLHQSKAGIGNKLNTHKFMLIIAQITSIKDIQYQIVLLIKSTIQIGQET